MLKIKLKDLKNDKEEKLSIYLSMDKKGFFLSCFKIESFFKKRAINKSKYCSFQHIEEIMSQGYLDRFIIDSLKTLYKEEQKEKKYEHC